MRFFSDTKEDAVTQDPYSTLFYFVIVVSHSCEVLLFSVSPVKIPHTSDLPMIDILNLKREL